MGQKADTPTAKVAKRASNPARGSKPGERRGGREKGVPNKATIELKTVAREYTAEAVQALARIMRDAESPAAAVVSAANALLDRGYGKPATILAGDQEGGAIQSVHRIELVGVAPK